MTSILVTFTQPPVAAETPFITAEPSPKYAEHYMAIWGANTMNTATNNTESTELAICFSNTSQTGNTSCIK